MKKSALEKHLQFVQMLEMKTAGWENDLLSYRAVVVYTKVQGYLWEFTVSLLDQVYTLIYV